MKRVHILLAMFLAGLLAACLIAAYLTRDTRPTASPAKQQIDQGLFRTAQQLAALADSRQERGFGRDAVRLSDHELDQAFASALRESAAATTPKTGPLKELADHIDGWAQKVAADQDRITKLTAQGNAAPAGQLDLAKAQLELDQDELDDAHQDLARQGGDQHARIERAIQQHEATEHNTAQPESTATASATTTLNDQLRAWFSLRNRQQQVEAAEEQAASHISELAKQHDALDKLAAPKSPDAAATVADLQMLSGQRKSLADLDKRIQDTQQLMDTYGRWRATVQTRRTAVLHLLLNSIAVVLAILFATVLIDFAIRRAFQRHNDPRRLHQAQVMTSVAVQFTAVVLIILVVFGPPNQVSTLLGLATAGLTVVLRDFILAILGWFALMGRNGIRIGDWVEIGGVSGEVVELGVFKTVLLEVGDSGSAGHQTGRRVSFMNGFAVDGHYFNFSTAGQWLWDELQVSLPASSEPHQLALKIRDVVERETLADVTEAEKDWERVTHKYGTKPFSAKPVADLRPAATGFNLILRYITHAPQRNEVKSRIFKEIVDLLHAPA